EDVVLAAIARALASGGAGTVVGVDIERHGRDFPLPGLDLSDAVGWFTTVFPVYLELPDDPRGALIAAKEAIHGVPDGGLPFGVLRTWGGLEARARIESLPEPEVVFNFLGAIADATASSSLFCRIRERSAADNHGPANARSHLLEVTGAIRDGGLRVEVAFSR